MELGRDSDTGGQVKYVVELAKALSSCPGVYRVDMLTRQILAPNFDRCYGEPVEALESLLLYCLEHLMFPWQEIEEQWNLYDGFEVILARKLRARAKRGANCYGRYVPRMVIIPPGVEFGHITHDFDMDGEEDGPSPASEDPSIWFEIMRFFTNPRKPMILAVARPYPEKNITALVKAFGECQPLRELANLTLIMGNREAVSKMHNMSAAVLTSVLSLIDEYDLYGQVAYPKHHKQSEVPDIYRLAVRTKGAFVNVPYFEQFGVTLIEAAMHGFACKSHQLIAWMMITISVPMNIRRVSLGRRRFKKISSEVGSSVVERRGRIEKQVIFEDSEHSSTYCLAFKVVNPNHLPPLKELQKLMRVQSLRCQALYNHGATRLSVIPIHASRSKALRYLSVRWGIKLKNIIVLVGETGDSDYEELFGGLHKTVILKGEFNTPANRIHTVRRYPLQDVVALDSSNIIGIDGCSTDDMRSTLQQLGLTGQ
ncbi:hypothetical protein GUJ93_ZPchr0012g20091 [Zizania palustris]|uniref:Sucrose phosphatase-like domain-containing protein n=1 Tax=Zizania palustris TaxID=103762 RepID=A0A8J5WQN8_ZIZPA|nr:hypothetical protein GUJ93_ZPchr0012g20091 [Zizania palustris]